MPECLAVHPHDHVEDGPDGTELISAYRKMVLAHDVFPGGTVVVDVLRRPGLRDDVRHVRVKLDDTAKYAFVLRRPYKGFDWRPDHTLGTGIPYGLVPPAVGASGAASVQGGWLPRQSAPKLGGGADPGLSGQGGSSAAPVVAPGPHQTAFANEGIF